MMSRGEVEERRKEKRGIEEQRNRGEEVGDRMLWRGSEKMEVSSVEEKKRAREVLKKMMR